MSSPPDSPATILKPHPVLSRYYQEDEQRRSFVGKLFDDAAGHYDRLEQLMSLGSGRWYRREALKRAGLSPGMKVLDVATGTGLVAREALGIVGPGGRVIGIDPSVGMLSEAAGALPIALVRGRAEELPFAPESFDFVSMGYALRHMADLTGALRQFFLVLKPGGILLMLEITAPRRGLRRMLLGDYMGRLVPAISKVLPGGKAKRDGQSDRLLLEYYRDTIAHCVDPEIILEAMRATGLANPRRRLELGIFSEYTAAKPG
ncbi:MAG: class I SAM-dependent methyltransferase [Tepidisphaeraceae bacterium]